jgi:hypothetical protein
VADSMPGYVRADKNQDDRLDGRNIGEVYLVCQKKVIDCRELAANVSTAPDGDTCYKNMPGKYTNCLKAVQGTYDCQGTDGSTLHDEPILIKADEYPPVLGKTGPYPGSDEDKCRYLCQILDKKNCVGWSFGRFQNAKKDEKHCYRYNRIGSTNTDSKGKAQYMVFAPRVARKNKN